jgi:pimeloyl-ACP methyl ester carboxylesterase
MAIPVLLLHCSGSTGAQWQSLATKLGPRYRAIAPDLDSARSLASVSEPLVRHIGEPVHLVGHSYGGGVAMHVARTRPWLVRSLTLVEPSAFHLLDGAARAEIDAVAGRVKTDLAIGDCSDGYGRFVDYWAGQGTWAAMPAEKRAALAPQLSRVDHEFDALLNEPARLDDFRALVLPTLLVQGGSTKLPSRAICQRLAATQAQFRVVPGAGHMLPLTHRDAVNALIAEHLDFHSDQRIKETA